MTLLKSIAKKNVPLLDQRNTELFIKDIEEICKKVEFSRFAEIFDKYPLDNFGQGDRDYFLAQANREHQFWHNNSLEVKIKSVEEFESKCIACSFGKKVKGYSVEFLKMKDDRLPGRFNYKKSFAINFEIKDNELMDFGWCNAFLEQQEVEALETNRIN